MHTLNSAHIGAAIICGLFTLMVGFGIAAVVETIHERRNHRARVEPCTTTEEFQHSPYGDKR